MSATRLVTPMAEEWLITSTIAALAPANTVTAATIQRAMGEAALAQQQTPLREVFHIEDIYFQGANPAPDVGLRIKIDNVSQTFTPLATSVNIANLYKLRLPRTLVITRGSFVSAEMVNIAAVGAVAITVTFRAKVMRVPVEA